jgi:hypothetical protein
MLLVWQQMRGKSRGVVTLPELSHDISNRYPHPHIVESNNYSMESSMDDHSVAYTNCMPNSNDFQALEDKPYSIGWECKPFEFVNGISIELVRSI